MINVEFFLFIDHLMKLFNLFCNIRSRQCWIC